MFLIVRKLLYNVVLIAAVQQCKSVIIAYMCVYIYIYIYSLALESSYPPLFHPSRSLQSTRLGSLCYIAISHNLHIHYSVYMSKVLSQIVLPSPSPIGSTSLFSTRFISTICLNSIYMHQYMIFVFSLSDLFCSI